VGGDAGGRCAYWALWLLDVAVTCVVPGVLVPAFLLPASCYRHCGPWEPWESWGSLGNCQPLLPRLPLFASCRARYFRECPLVSGPQQQFLVTGEYITMSCCKSRFGIAF
jgi:hypothetical protein